MVVGLQNTIQHRVAHVDVGRRHVDLGPQRVLPVFEFPAPHAAKEIETLRRRPIAIGARLTRLGECAAIFANLVGVQAADVGVPLLNQLLGPLVQLLEIVRGVELAIVPTEAQPADVLFNGVDVLDVFLGGIRIVEAEVALAAELLGDAEVEADRFRVPDVQIAIGLGRKAGHHFATVLAGLLILGHDRADEVERGGRGGGRRCAIGHNWRSVCYLVSTQPRRLRARSMRLSERCRPNKPRHSNKPGPVDLPVTATRNA